MIYKIMEYRITCGNPGCKKVFKGKTETDVRGRLSQHAHSTECFKAPGASEEQWNDLAWTWTGEQDITSIKKPVNPPSPTPPSPTPDLLPGGRAPRTPPATAATCPAAPQAAAILDSRAAAAASAASARSALEAATTACTSATATAHQLRDIGEMMQEMLTLVQHIYHWTRPNEARSRSPTRTRVARVARRDSRSRSRKPRPTRR